MKTCGQENTGPLSQRSWRSLGFALVREKMERIDMPEQLEQIEAVIFDLDGSLVDSMWIWRDIDIEFLAARGLELPDDFQRAIEGMSFTETAVYSRERFGLSESVEELKAIWNQMAMDKYSCEVPFKPGALRFLKYCKSRGIRMGIATSNSRELVAAVDGALKLSDYIEQVVTSCEVPKGKPAPDVYLEAARRLAVQPARCLVYGPARMPECRSAPWRMHFPGICWRRSAGLRITISLPTRRSWRELQSICQKRM